ncbi:hypothetical protein Ddye_006003 [Dipteronia dyeriana]|uniref:CCHC-type domain-containing protein n=1 Tax=Dipteronia dyeriana TaxID=168575 RepID=A0AAE0CQ56_9ROSI|nr:hypothetical protein Ddye_006003 [Dipteronia dyeriana]
MIYERKGVSREKVELKLTSHVKTNDVTVTLSIMSDDDVEFMIIHKEKGFTQIYISRNEQATPVFTTKHAVVDDKDIFKSINTSGRFDSSKISDIEDESGGDDDGGQVTAEDGTEEQGVSRRPNSYSHSMITHWIVSGSELYSVKAFRLVNVFEKSVDQGSLYKGQMFKNKITMKGVLGLYAFVERNEMIYPLPFRFADSECIESWTWFLKKLHKLIQYLNRVMLVSDRRNGIFNAMEAIFPNAAHGIYAYHLAQNLKKYCKQRNDVISLYYRATYAYHIEDFDSIIDELKETYHKNLLRRPKKLRIPSAGEKRKVQSCSKCGQKGHNKKTCLEASCGSPCKPANKARTCTICKKECHNRLNCPDKPTDPTFIDTDKAKDKAAR